jgi:hypothetical protein
MKSDLKCPGKLPEMKTHDYKDKIANGSPNSCSNYPFKIEICMVSTCLSLSIIFIGIMGIFSKTSKSIPLIILIFVNIIAVLSAYAALWTLACSCSGTCSVNGLSEILSLLTKPGIYKTYWLIAWALLFWLILSCIIGKLILGV